MEAYWAGKIDEKALEGFAAGLRAEVWRTLRDARLDAIPSNTFSYYDHMLDTAVAVGAVPERFRRLDLSDLDTYFARARGVDAEPALEAAPAVRGDVLRRARGRDAGPARRARGGARPGPGGRAGQPRAAGLGRPDPRSKMEILDDLRAAGYARGIGPGVWDIHSPRVPGEDEVVDALRRAVAVVPADRLWVNPDCGLKTRDYPEVEASLTRLAAAARVRAG